MHRNISLGSTGMDWVCSLRKIPTRLRGTNFCTSSARFAPSFIRQPNGPKCTQIVRNTLKHQFRVQWGGSGAFVAKNYDTTLWHELLHLFGPFCIEFRSATKGSSMHPNRTNAPKHQFRVHWDGSGAFVAKNSDATSCTNFCTSSARFALSFIMQPNGPQCTQIEQTHQTISLGSTGMDRVRSLRKIPTRLRGTKFCTSSARFAPSFVRQLNGPKCTQIVRNTLKHLFGGLMGWTWYVRCEKFRRDFVA